MQKYEVGLVGEDMAADYLASIGFTVIERRYHSGHLETDIIAADGEYILFTEVKTRRDFPDGAHPYGTPSLAVNARKKANLISAAQDYLRTHPNETADLRPRIDVIEVYLDPRKDEPRLLHLNHFRNAVHRRREVK